MVGVDAGQIINEWLTGNYLNAILLPYTQLMGDMFYGILFMVLIFSTWIKSRSIGMVAYIGFIFGALYIGQGLLNPMFSTVIQWMLILVMAGVLYWVIMGRRGY